eukprot:3505845-Alexandrium_andersonii.AAC.1
MTRASAVVATVEDVDVVVAMVVTVVVVSAIITTALAIVVALASPGRAGQIPSMSRSGHAGRDRARESRA